jgi:hypothetical protein
MKTMRGRPYSHPAATVQKWATKLHASLFRATAGQGRREDSRLPRAATEHDVKSPT